jgi:putative sterol carrier protein
MFQRCTRDTLRVGLAKTKEEEEVPVFKDEQEVYRYIGRLFQELTDDPELSPKFRRADTIVQYRYSNPESQITVKMKEGEEGQVDFGPSDLDPEIVMMMEADTAHRFWLGRVNVTMALAKGQMKAKGPVAKILKLVPLVKPVFPRYEKMLEEEKRDDLLKAA